MKAVALVKTRIIRSVYINRLGVIELHHRLLIGVQLPRVMSRIVAPNS